MPSYCPWPRIIQSLVKYLEAGCPTTSSTMCSTEGQFLYLRSVIHHCCSVTQSNLTLQPHRLQHNRLPRPSPSPGACSDSCPSSWSCHPIISSSVVPFSSCLQSFTASGSFQMSQLFTSGGQNIGVSASTSVLPMNIQD